MTEPTHTSHPGRVRRTGLLLKGLLLLVACVLPLGGCRGRQAGGAPSVEFSSVPMAEQGGTQKLDDIEGRVVGARDGRRIVLYARSGAWYVQPYADRPFTDIRPDSTWKNSTHLGTEYAALLVEEDYNPPAQIDELPKVGGGVVALTFVPGDVVFWKKGWFRASAGLLLALALMALYRYRLRRLTRHLNLRFEERLAERTRIAQEIHDTFLQDVISVSMQLHVVVDGLPADSHARAPLGHIHRLMGRVIEEGRNTLKGLRFDEGATPELAEAFSLVAREFGPAKRIDYRVTVEGRPRPLHPLISDDVYRIGRDALARAFEHPGTGNVEVRLEYGRRRLRVKVRSEGEAGAKHIPTAGRGGFEELKERAERMGGRFKVRGRTATGTELELSVPADVAFRTEHSTPPRSGPHLSEDEED
ncbi:MAG: histidine kinase [Pyrinomonadaceae bacterium]